MKQKLIAVILIALTAVQASAQRRSLDEMLEIAEQTFNVTGPLRAPGRGTGTSSLTVDMQSDELAVINREAGGWVIVSADSRTASDILAYSRDGHFSWQDAPDNVRSMLQSYRQQISTLDSDDGDTVDIMPGNPVIGPLIATQWGQDSPYNNDCYSEEFKYGSFSYTRHTLVGCVALAMAQIMNYWRWPDCGTHSHFDLRMPSQRVDFSQSVYDWDNMKNSYSHSYRVDEVPDYTEEQAAAVAKLCFDCGVAVDMLYGYDGSMAFSEFVPGAMSAFFKYDSGCRYVSRDDMQCDWDSLLKTELDSLRPVLYGACETAGGDYGHQFICDGYDDNGYFHFNFGWDGEDDGYYLTSAIDTRINRNHFNYWQDAVIGIRPATEDRTIWQDSLCFLKSGPSQVTLIALSGEAMTDSVLVTPEYVMADGVRCTIALQKGMFYSVPCLSGAVLNGVSEIGEEAFGECPNLRTVMADDNLKRVESFAFYDCRSLMDFQFGNSLEYIGESAFYNCRELTSVFIPNSVRALGESCFNSCASLDTLVLGDGLDEIPPTCFYLCKSLKTVRIPDSVKRIASGSFRSCSSLEQIYLGSSVSHIEELAFGFCRALTDVTCTGTVPPLADDDSNPFQVDLEAVTLHVPSGCADAYRDAPVWKEFGRIVEMDVPASVRPLEVVPAGKEYRLNSHISILDGKKYLR